ncbi:MAG: hypothetical protein QNK23_14275 [Crocinitomicaceae bacterium]|nr:hypothetical protein [Crocinitomicaceae bacterium]
MRRYYTFFIPSLMAVLASMFLNSCNSKENAKRELLEEFPILKTLELDDLKVDKTLADISYKAPFTTLIEFESLENVKAELNLHSMEDVAFNESEVFWHSQDSMLFFSMASINGETFERIQERIDGTSWWMGFDKIKVYSAPIVYDYRKIVVVPFDEMGNGRISYCKKNGKHYVIVECWSF